MFGQDLGIGADFGRETGIMVCGGPELPGIAASEHGRAGGGALGIGGVGAGEEDAIAGDAVEGRGFHPGAAVGTRVAGGPVIGDGDQDVGAWVRDGANR